VLTKAQSAQSACSAEPIAITIVVPCYNEVTGLHHLRDRLMSAVATLESHYHVNCIVVDDGSTDGTWKVMRDVFPIHPHWTLVRHPSNRGIGAAIFTGIREASTEIVCSIDADCSYDPRELAKLIPMLVPGVDLVTASPYHPAGTVVGVPSWRLFLSRTASSLYRLVTRQKLHTYTSCFRVYRRSSILKVDLRRRDFLAIAELIGKMDLNGAVVVECPSSLATRLYGKSKMKTARTLVCHLCLLTELLTLRVWQVAFGGRALSSDRSISTRAEA